LFKKIKNGVGRGSVYISANQWLIEKEKKFGIGGWVIREYLWESVANKIIMNLKFTTYNLKFQIFSGRIYEEEMHSN
jgi:hypothetical protein